MPKYTPQRPQREASYEGIHHGYDAASVRQLDVYGNVCEYNNNDQTTIYTYIPIYPIHALMGGAVWGSHAHILSVLYPLSGGCDPGILSCDSLGCLDRIRSGPTGH